MVVLVMCGLTAYKLFDSTYSSQILDNSTSLLPTLFLIFTLIMEPYLSYFRHLRDFLTAVIFSIYKRKCYIVKK